jgi:hypothetical protein
MPHDLHAPKATRAGKASEETAPRYALLAALVTLVSGAAVAVSATLPVNGLGEHPIALMTLLGLTAIVGSRAIRIASLRVEVTAGDAFMFCGLFTVGPLAAPLIAFTGVLGSLTTRRPKRPIRIIFNMATLTLSAALAARACLVVAGDATLATTLGAAGLLVAAAVFVVSNTVLVALAIRLERQRSFLAALRSFIALAANSGLTSLLIGLGLYTLHSSLGSVGLLAGLSASVMIGAAVKRFRDRMDDGAGTVPAASSH